jgi:hypothetical protein
MNTGTITSSGMHMQRIYDVKSAEVSMQQPFGQGHDMGRASPMVTQTQAWPQDGGVSNNGEYWNDNHVQYFQ